MFIRLEIFSTEINKNNIVLIYKTNCKQYRKILLKDKKCINSKIQIIRKIKWVIKYIQMAMKIKQIICTIYRIINKQIFKITWEIILFLIQEIKLLVKTLTYWIYQTTQIIEKSAMKRIVISIIIKPQIINKIQKQTNKDLIIINQTCPQYK